MGRLARIILATTAIVAIFVVGLLFLQEPEFKYETSKVCQVTGITDLEQPTRPTGVQRTGLTGGVTGTDLGFPFEYQGRLLMLFGDSREFHPDRCEPAWCGTDPVKDNPPTGLKRWRSQAHWNAWIASREEGADSIATGPVQFDPDQCIPVAFESDERGSVYQHVVSDSIDAATRLSGPPVASRPEDKWVTVLGDRLLVITNAGQVFVHPLSGSTIGAPFQLSGPAVAARPEDRWVVPIGDRLLVVTSDGRVFAHRITATAVEPAIQLSGDKVAARPEDRWVVAGGDKLFVITNDGRVFAHSVTGNTLSSALGLTGPPVAAQPYDKWVLYIGNRLLIVTNDGDVFSHSVTNNVISVARRLEGPYVAAQPQDRRVIAAQNKILVLTGPDGRFRTTKLDGQQVGRQEGAIGAITHGDRIYAFFTMKNAQGLAHDDEIGPGGRTVLSASTDGGRNFKTITDISTKKFLWTVPEVHTASGLAGLPRNMTGDVVLMWGAGRENMQGQPTSFHRSYPYLAVAPLGSIGDLSSWRYYSGSNALGIPRWVNDEQLARPVLPFGAAAINRDSRFGPGYHECLGYFTVRRIDAWSKWVMLYVCNDDVEHGYNGNNGPRGIYLRSADMPWGPWSKPKFIFHPALGYCHFMHHRHCPPGTPNPLEESVRDVKKPELRGWGAEYAPILLPSRYVKSDGDETIFYFLLATWNPYQVVLMRTRATRTPWWQQAAQTVQFSFGAR